MSDKDKALEVSRSNPKETVAQLVERAARAAAAAKLLEELESVRMMLPIISSFKKSWSDTGDLLPADVREKVIAKGVSALISEMREELEGLLR